MHGVAVLDRETLFSPAPMKSISLNIFICINVYAMGLGYKLLQHYQWPSPNEVDYLTGNIHNDGSTIYYYLVFILVFTK